MVDGVCVRRIVKRAEKIANVSPEEARAVGEDCAMRAEEKDMIAGLCAALCQKYGVLGQYAPEVLLVGVVAGYSGRLWWAARRLDELAPQKQQTPGDGEKRDGKN